MIVINTMVDSKIHKMILNYDYNVNINQKEVESLLYQVTG